MFACTSENNIIKTNNQKHLRENKTINIQLIQPEPERYLFAVEWWAGCPVFVVLCFFSKVCCLFLLLFCLFCFWLLPSLVRLSHV